jgi:hypothetical protein
MISMITTEIPTLIILHKKRKICMFCVTLSKGLYIFSYWQILTNRNHFDFILSLFPIVRSKGKGILKIPPPPPLYML